MKVITHAISDDRNHSSWNKLKIMKIPPNLFSLL